MRWLHVVSSCISLLVADLIITFHATGKGEYGGTRDPSELRPV
jgi:hypothetical protein